MTDLDDLVQALRTEHTGHSDRAASTRSRVMMSLHEGKHRRRLRWGFGIPLSAILVGSTAWAGAGGHLGVSAQAAVESIAAWLGVGEPSASPPPASRSTNASRSTGTPPAVAPPSEAPKTTPETPPAPPDSAPPDSAPPDSAPSDSALVDAGRTTPPEAHAIERKSPPPASATPRPRPTAANTSTATSPPTSPPPPETSISEAMSPEAMSPEDRRSPVEDPHLVHYRQAHDAQFAQGDCAAAVAGYERYLRQAPRGALVPEARFNRALCLVRLDRHEQAERALRPFAEGHYGAYRQEDALRLLDALGAR